MAFGDADASTPAFVKANSAGKNATTASFTPPSGAVLIAHCDHDTAGGNVTSSSAVTSSDGASGTGVTAGGWHAFAEVSKANDGAGFANGHLKLWWAEATGVAMTVTTTGTNTNNPAAIYVRVVTGVDTTTPIDVVQEGTNTNAVVSQAITTVTSGARGFIAAIDWNLAANMTAGSNQTAVVADGIGAPDMRVYVGVQNAVTSPAGSVTMSTATPTTGNTNNWAAYALRPAAGGSSTNANAENTAGTGAANAASVDAQVNSGNAAATGASNTASTAVTVNAENATAAGAAFDATVSTAAETSANAETTTGTGAANTASVSVGPSAEASTGSAAANDAAAGVAAAAEAASGSGAAADAQAALTGSAGVAAGSGAAFDASISITVEAELITAVAAAFAATVSDGDADAKATSVSTVTADDASTALVTAGRTSTSAVTARATSSGGVT